MTRRSVKSNLLSIALPAILSLPAGASAHQFQAQEPQGPFVGVNVNSFHNSKPYWLTEWGFKGTASAGNNDPARQQAVAQRRNAFQPLLRHGRLKGIFWYVWNEPDPYAIYQGGALVQAGKTAIAPAR